MVKAAQSEPQPQTREKQVKWKSSMHAYVLMFELIKITQTKDI